MIPGTRLHHSFDGLNANWLLKSISVSHHLHISRENLIESLKSISMESQIIFENPGTVLINPFENPISVDIKWWKQNQLSQRRPRAAINDLYKNSCAYENSMLIHHPTQFGWRDIKTAKCRYKHSPTRTWMRILLGISVITKLFSKKDAKKAICPG